MRVREGYDVYKLLSLTIIIMYDTIIGIDVWCETLSLYCTHTQQSDEIKNTPDCVRKYLQKYSGMNILVLYEATWVYSNTILKVCNDLWLQHYQLHPTQFAQVCKWLWKKNKTDVLDAKAIATFWLLMLETMGTLTKPSTDETRELLGYLSSINSLRKGEQRHINLLHKLEKDVYSDKAMIPFHERQLHEIQEQIAWELWKIEKRLVELWYKEKLENLETIPWIGAVVKIHLVLFFVDLLDKGFTAEDKNKVVAYAWLNPLQQQSGTSLNRTTLSKRWRTTVRQVLYMPMLQRYQLITKDKYQNTNLGKFFIRMRTKFESWDTKRWRSVVTAMMKKTLLIAWSIFCNDTQYNRS